jgi:PhzF family phenazine biosynthesis protein
MKLYEVAAFTRNNSGGNLAGAVFDDYLTNEQKQLIAKKANYSETIFLKKITNTSYQVSYYTINSEIDFCGHASIAASYIINKLDNSIKDIVFITYNEKINLLIEDNLIYLKMPDAKIFNAVNNDIIASSLNIDLNNIIYPAKIVSVGIPDIMVIVDSLETLKSIKQNKDEVKQISQKYKVTGYHVLAIDNNKYYTRNFAPLYGIDEESATGSASASMYAYLNSLELIDNNSIEFLQGDCMNEPSSIYTFMNGCIYVGGACKLNKIKDLIF